jgi:predicted HTH domain antitoxin
MRWAIDELKKLSEIQPERISKLLDEIWKKNPEIHRSVIIGAYVDGKISLSKAAESLGMTRIELLKELLKKGIPVRTLSKEDVIAEVEALRLWKR